MKVALIGAKGAVGRVLISIIEDNWKDIDLHCFGSEVGLVSFDKNPSLEVKTLKDFKASDYDLIFSAAPDEVALSLREEIEESGVPWVDKSSALRSDENIPLVICEINDKFEGKIASSPNCVAIPASLFLKSIEKFGVSSVVISTYQAVSGAGAKARNMLSREMKSSFMSASIQPLFEKHPMANNVIPEIGEVDDDNFCQEERKVEAEIKKIIPSLSDVSICVNVARVPVFVGHGMWITFQLDDSSVNSEKIIKQMATCGVLYSGASVTPQMVVAEDLVYASRLKNHGNGFWSVWVICDNLRKGAALNAFQIGCKLVGR